MTTTPQTRNRPTEVGGHASYRPTEATGHADLLKLADVLEELDVQKSTFFRWKALGRAPKTIKYPNGSLRIRRRDLDAWLAAHEEAA